MTCALGHERHESLLLDIKLDGQYAPDFASFPPYRKQEFQLEVFNYGKYASPLSGFCPGREASHIGLIEQGIWEPWETRLALEILATSKPSRILDFGANIGWYSVLAILEGHKASAWEADPETAKLLSRNLSRVASTGGLFEVYPQRVDASYGMPEYDDVLLLKADVEGMEPEIIEVCAPLIEERKVEYLMLEISPVFREGYGKMLAGIVEQGYDLFLIPNKDCAYLEEFSADPLKVIGFSQIKDIPGFVASIKQENVLLRRHGR